MQRCCKLSVANKRRWRQRRRQRQRRRWRQKRLRSRGRRLPFSNYSTLQIKSRLTTCCSWSFDLLKRKRCENVGQMSICHFNYLFYRFKPPNKQSQRAHRFCCNGNRATRRFSSAASLQLRFLSGQDDETRMKQSIVGQNMGCRYSSAQTSGRFAKSALRQSIVQLSKRHVADLALRLASPSRR